MDSLKMSLVDNDYVTQAETDLHVNGDIMDAFSVFLSRVKEELVTGKTATLHIKGKEKDSAMFEITQLA